MKNLVMSYKMCGFVLVVCLVIVLIMAVVDGTIESSTVVNHGTCAAGTLERAGARANSISNNLRHNDTVLTLTCDGKTYVTAQADVIAGWYKAKADRLYCTYNANGVADCMVPVPTESAK